MLFKYTVNVYFLQMLPKILSTKREIQYKSVNPVCSFRHSKEKRPDSLLKMAVGIEERSVAKAR